jgi:hypothetical protein
MLEGDAVAVNDERTERSAGAVPSLLSRTLVRALKRAVRDGYEPQIEREPATEWPGVPLSVNSLAPCYIVLPTYLERCSPAVHADNISQAFSQFTPPATPATIAAAHLIFALQHRPEDAAAAHLHVAAVLGALAPEILPRLHVLLLDLHGKVPALNVVIATLRGLGHDGLVGWIDDDIDLAPDCVARMANHLDRHPGVELAGASKVPVANYQQAAKFWFRIKRVVKSTGRPHPHGCMMLARMSAVGEGIPTRYIGEDGYLALRLFDETAVDPFHRLAVVPEAQCRHVVGGPFFEIVHRVRRTFYENAIFLADFPLPRSALFADLCLFHGIVYQPELRRGSLANRFLQWLTVFGYFKVAWTLYWRGLRKRPMSRISWNAYQVHSRPSDRN